MVSLTHAGASISLALVILAGGSTYAADTVHYRWKNEKGGTVYSDRPPPKGINYEVVSSESSLKRSVSGQEGAVPAEIKPRPGNEFAVEDTESVNKKNPELCERARMNLLSLNSDDKVRIRDDKGEVRELTAQEREIAKQTAQATIDTYCD